MPDSNTPLRITDADLKSPDVQSYVETQAYLRRDVGPVADQPWVIRIIYANWFYLAVCCAIGGLVAWAITEPFFDDNDIAQEATLAGILIFPAVAACVGLFLGAAEGIMCRNPRTSRSASAASLALVDASSRSS